MYWRKRQSLAAFQRTSSVSWQPFTFSDLRELSTQRILFHSSVDYWRTLCEVFAVVKHISAVILLQRLGEGSSTSLLSNIFCQAKIEYHKLFLTNKKNLGYDHFL